MFCGSEFDFSPVWVCHEPPNREHISPTPQPHCRAITAGMGLEKEPQKLPVFMLGAGGRAQTSRGAERMGSWGHPSFQTLSTRS